VKSWIDIPVTFNMAYWYNNHCILYYSRGTKMRKISFTNTFFILLLTISLLCTFKMEVFAASIPKVAIVSLDHAPFVEGDSNNFHISATNYYNNVEYQLFYIQESVMKDWKIINIPYSSNNWTRGNTKPDEPVLVDITKLNLKPGNYRFAIRVRRVGVKGLFQNKYGDYDNAYAFNLTVLKSTNVKLNGNMNIEKTNFLRSENLVINGVGNASKNIQYKLHLFDVKNNKWLTNLTSYNTSINYSLKNIPVGTYIVDIWAKDIKSKNKYDGYKLKIITISKGNITLGTTQKEVRSLLGSPLESWRYDNIFYMEYDKGTLYLSCETSDYSQSIHLDWDYTLGKVLGWDNRSIPNIVLGPKESVAAPFKIGSSMKEVSKACGTPKFIPPYYFNEKDDYWIYPDDSIVFFDENEKAISYINNGSLKVSLGVKQPAAPPINHKSKIVDLINAMGTPDTVNAFFINSVDYSKYNYKVTTYPDPFTGDTYTMRYTSDYTYYQYKSSFVAFDKNEKIIYFLNGGDLNLNFGEKDPNFKGISIESTEDDIVKAMGTPDKILENTDYKRNWFYGDSYVQVDELGKVIGWKNKGNLSISKNDSILNSPVITIGSTRNDVVNAMGTPPQFYYNIATYGDSQITFDDKGQVKKIFRTDGVKLSNSNKDILSTGFYFGSSVDDVMKAMGTPDRLEMGGYNGKYVAWCYGVDYYGASPNASVFFNLEGKVVYWETSNYSNFVLKVSSSPQFDSAARPITIGSTKDDVLRVIGTPTSLSAPEVIKNSWWSYGAYEPSYIYFDGEDKVMGWKFNESNPKVFIGAKVEGSTFTSGSTKEEVLSAMGTPKAVLINNFSPLEQWVYDDCSVSFDTATNKVNSWTNASKLMLTKRLPDTTAQPFKVGSSEEDVLKVMGTPSSIYIYPLGNTQYSLWGYGGSAIDFTKEGKVLRIYNNDGTLRTE
jgi:outer membrane protein assembly factor BamE (lipoprotein component of BamABCDE complex)